MVKVDIRRDYYADLGLTPSADAEDIKKQFRKLALKYHPDRNPGKEVEFISKFQAIQAANEILSDPQQRLRYDTDRLRAGYGKYYGPPKSNSPRKAPSKNFPSSPSAKPQAAKPSFASRPQSFHSGPSSGAQRYASYARAAPKQPWEKMHDEGQTRADAYRGFQDMKGNHTSGWSQFDPRTGRSGYSGATPRTNASSASQSTRPKSAYEYFKTSPKSAGSESTRAHSTKKKQGFAPRSAGGDEPMAPNTSSYSNVPRNERPQMRDFFGPAPSPTARKAAAGFQNREENSSTPEVERTGSKYAGTGGEKTFFSSAWLGRSASMRESPGSPKPHARTNPPSPTPRESGRHRSASPKFKTDHNRNYTSTSSSDIDDEDANPEHKPKAVPKSRLRPHQRYANFHTQQKFDSKTGHDSDSASSTQNMFGASRAGDPFVQSQSPRSRNVPPTGAFNSKSHDDLRKPFSATSWNTFDFFTPSSSDKEQPQPKQGSSSRGRTAARNSPGRTSHSTSTSNHDPSRSGSTFEQQPTAFTKGKFSADDWADKFKDLLWAMPKDNGHQQQQQPGNAQRAWSPRKHTRSATKTRVAPQAASVATEAEEAKATVDGDDDKQDSARAGEEDGEAMDLDDDSPAKDTTVESDKAAKSKVAPPPKPTPPSSDNVGKEEDTKPTSRHFDLKNLGKTAPFISTTDGGIEDLQDIHSSLPFESRAKPQRTTVRDVRPRELICPNPPKRPQPPQPVQISAGSQQLGLPRKAWDRYVAEMKTYMREWNHFNRRMLHHFNARQEAIETGMAANWISAVGDSTRLKINGQDEDPDDRGGDGNDSDDEIVSGGKAGYSAYLRGLDEDAKVLKHWEVAREMHRECILKLGQTREWILNGGKVI
ncbi:DnaJ domain protein [Aspergillus bombycis]|uniref:DnaJ domain protein n=1 Tax=Aspergillus bombycis TaxID=109264 RepID=A0A1F8A4Z9_9EURO|nr:DnaJ domain protein [Aspergillus bombycis]OGM46763.1 DnaJ domain protein [Aspergillus bombycis]